MLTQFWPVVAAAACLVWVFWPSLRALAERWATDSEYSHGYLVPLFSAYLLWARRDRLDATFVRPSWWGLAILAAGLALRFGGTLTYFDWLSAAAVIPCLAGLVVLAGGWHALRWSWPALAFLVFMIPLPYRFEVALAQPLQRVATVASTYALQTFGFPAFAEGNVIRMGDTRIGVVEACSGLSMLLIFFALATAVVLVVKRHWIDKAIILLSAIPVAIIANVIRITVTGMLYQLAGPKLAEVVFHDLAGWLMMPLALALLLAELRILDWVLVPAASVQRGPAQAPSRGRAMGRLAPKAVAHQTPA